jgi:hypothetical protein
LRLRRCRGECCDQHADAERKNHERSAKAQHLETPAPGLRASAGVARPRVARKLLRINTLSNAAGAPAGAGRSTEFWLMKLERIWLTRR